MINKKHLAFTVALGAATFGLFTNCTDSTSRANGKTNPEDSLKVTKAVAEVPAEDLYTPVDTAKYNKKTSSYCQR